MGKAGEGGGVGEGGGGGSRLRRDRRWTTRGREGGACANERH